MRSRATVTIVLAFFISSVWVQLRQQVPCFLLHGLRTK